MLLSKKLTVFEKEGMECLFPFRNWVGGDEVF